MQDLPDNAQELLLFAMVLVGLLLITPYIISIVWAYRDAEARGKSGCAVALLVALLSWPIGLLIWLVFRPEKTRGGSGREAASPG